MWNVVTAYNVFCCWLFVLDVFKPDDSFMENEEKYKQLKKGAFANCIINFAIWCLLTAVLFCDGIPAPFLAEDIFFRFTNMYRL